MTKRITPETDEATGRTEFACYLDEEFIGYRGNYGDAEVLLDATLYKRLNHQVALVCPDCGAALARYGTKRNRRREQHYICPVARSEETTDERGHLGRAPGARHQYTRVWRVDELAAAQHAA